MTEPIVEKPEKKKAETDVITGRVSTISVLVNNFVFAAICGTHLSLCWKAGTWFLPPNEVIAIAILLKGGSVKGMLDTIKSGK